MKKALSKKRPATRKSSDEMRPEYDFRGGVRGKYAGAYAEGANLVRSREELSIRRDPDKESAGVIVAQSCAGVNLLFQSGIENKRLRWFERDLTEIRMSGVDQVVSFILNNDRRHRERRTDVADGPVCADILCGLRR